MSLTFNHADLVVITVYEPLRSCDCMELYRNIVFWMAKSGRFRIEAFAEVSAPFIHNRST